MNKIPLCCSRRYSKTKIDIQVFNINTGGMNIHIVLGHMKLVSGIIQVNVKKVMYTT
jgi:hypothetical protein